MTIWLDAHFGPALALWISSTFGVACRTLTETGLEDDDILIFEAAARFSNVVLFTKDADFVLLLEQRGPPPQVIWLRCPNLRTIRLQNVLQTRMSEALQQIRSGMPLVQIVVNTQE
ncbi:MAG TPA: DUF5615 family PIN-like protein [Tepidisphaeraceae bacterium]|jgi:predicted nuclease of predicted toxin-antitoxin system